MKLKRVRTLAPVTLKGRVPGELYEVLAAYAGYYREVHGDRRVAAPCPDAARVRGRRP